MDKVTSLLYIIVANQCNLHLVKSVFSVSGVNTINLGLVEAESLTGDSHLQSPRTALDVLKSTKTMSGCPVCFKRVWLRYCI